METIILKELAYAIIGSLYKTYCQQCWRLFYKGTK
jgi:hypothetical protein